MTHRAIVLMVLQWFTWLGALVTGYFFGRARGLREAKEIYEELIKEHDCDRPL